MQPGRAPGFMSAPGERQPFLGGGSWVLGGIPAAVVVVDLCFRDETRSVHATLGPYETDVFLQTPSN